jgi:2,4-dienoyl-CoA reductase-like NADH-dependent reductase (Old Yellow Enzyme family)/thioredoxin reductase
VTWLKVKDEGGDMDFNRLHLGRRKFLTMNAAGLASAKFKDSSGPVLSFSATPGTGEPLQTLPGTSGAASSSPFPTLFESGRIGSMTLRNRIVMPSIAYVYPKPGGYVPQRMKDYLEERAKGGAGLVIVEYTFVESSQQFDGISLRLDGDKSIPSFAEAAQLIQRHGAKAGIQLGHAGNRKPSNSEPSSKQNSSPASEPFPNDALEAFTIDEIKRIVESFAKAAGRAKKAGFDGIEIHAAHGSNLLARFISPASNKRQDAYGGSIANRMRFPLEVMRAVREVVGSSYPVWFRINGGGTDGITAALTPEDVREQAVMLAANGADALSVSGLPDVRSYFAPMGYYVPLAELVKKAVRIPVIATGNITLEVGENVLKEGKADFVIMGRGLIADPQLPQKALSGRQADIATCLRCSFCRFGNTPSGMQCSVNATFGQERESQLHPASKSKKIVIIGGGPAGMEAARVAALRGHQVTLYEEGKRLGGQMLLAAAPQNKARIALFRDYLARQLDQLRVRVQLGNPATLDLIIREKPDVVILATGVIPSVPQIPGTNRKNIVTAQDILSKTGDMGGSVAILGSELIACEIASYLAEKGKQVTLAGTSTAFATSVIQSVKEPLLDLLKAKGVTMLSSVEYNEITDEGLIISTSEGSRKTIACDTIVSAIGSTPNKALLETITGKVQELYSIGDCVQPRNIYYAIYEGFHTSRIL